MPRKMYFAKVPLGIMDDNRFKPLAKKKNGDSLLVTAFQLLRVVANTDGMYTYSGDEETIEEELAFLADRDADQVTEVINYLVRKNLAEMVDGEGGKTFMYTVANEFVGSETESAERMRRMRAKKNGTSEENVSQSDVSASQSDVIKRREEKEKDKSRQEQTENDDVVTPPAKVWNFDESLESAKEFLTEHPEIREHYEEWYNQTIKYYPKGKRQTEAFSIYFMLVEGRLNPSTGKHFDKAKYSREDIANMVLRAINAYVNQNREKGVEERYYVSLPKFFGSTIFDYLDFNAYDEEIEAEQRKREREEAIAREKEAEQEKQNQLKEQYEAFERACEEMGYEVKKVDYECDTHQTIYWFGRTLEAYGFDNLIKGAERAISGEESMAEGESKSRGEEMLKEILEEEHSACAIAIMATYWLEHTDMSAR